MIPTCDRDDSDDWGTGPCGAAALVKYRKPGEPWGHRCAFHSQELNGETTIIHPVEAMFDFVSAGMILQVEAYLKSAAPAVRPSIPVVPGPLPHGAVEIICGWRHRDASLIHVLCCRYDINEPTARNWIWNVRHAKK